MAVYKMTLNGLSCLSKMQACSLLVLGIIDDFTPIPGVPSRFEYIASSKKKRLSKESIHLLKKIEGIYSTIGVDKISLCHCSRSHSPDYKHAFSKEGVTRLPDDGSLAIDWHDSRFITESNLETLMDDLDALFREYPSNTSIIVSVSVDDMPNNN